MVVAITGHTSGIGKGISNYFVNGGHLVQGFSRSNGFDISLPDTRKKIIQQAKECDIFVNNAYNNFDDSQFNLLKDIWQEWSGKSNKLIINVSTRWTKDTHPYCITKLAQDKFCESNMYEKPEILNLKPSWIDTPRVANQNKNKMPVDEFLVLFDFLIKNYKKHRVRTITFGE